MIAPAPLEDEAAVGMDLHASLGCAAEAATPTLRALLADQQLLPQQALGVLTFVADVLNRVLVNINDAEALAKFGRLKLSVLRKKVTHKPEHAEAILRVAGFKAVPAPQPEHLECHAKDAEALLAILAVAVLISQIQELAKNKGLHSLIGPFEMQDVTPRDILFLSFGGVRLLEMRNRPEAQTAASVDAALVGRALVQERLPQLAAAMEEFPSLFRPAAIFASRERSAKAAVSRAISEARAARGLGNQQRLASVPLLVELAQVAAGAELLRLRAPERFRPQALVAAPDNAAVGTEISTCDQEADEDVAPSVSADVVIVPTLASCIPAFRLGLPFGTMSHIVRLGEAPAFFTMDEREKAFQVSVTTMAERMVATWLEESGTSEALLRPEASSIGVGCSLDIGNDDKAIVFVVLA